MAKSCVAMVPFSSGTVIVLVVAVVIPVHSNASFFVASPLSLTRKVLSTKVSPGITDVSNNKVPFKFGTVNVRVVAVEMPDALNATCLVRSAVLRMRNPPSLVRTV